MPVQAAIEVPPSIRIHPPLDPANRETALRHRVPHCREHLASVKRKHKARASLRPLPDSPSGQCRNGAATNYPMRSDDLAVHAKRSDRPKFVQAWRPEESNRILLVIVSYPKGNKGEPTDIPFADRASGCPRGLLIRNFRLAGVCGQLPPRR